MQNVTTIWTIFRTSRSLRLLTGFWTWQLKKLTHYKSKLNSLNLKQRKNSYQEVKLFGSILLICLKKSFCTGNKAFACGVSNTKSDRIAGGYETIPNEFPWQARLIFYSGSYQIQCGGTLISDRWVLTAAQCILGSVVFYLKHNGTNSTLKFSPKKKSVPQVHKLYWGRIIRIQPLIPIGECIQLHDT